MIARSAAFACLAGLVSALAFQPVGLWPLMPAALALLCVLIARSDSIAGALLVGWAFGFGQFLVSLNWIATAFTFQAAMPAWLGWIAVFLLALYLAFYPALAAGLAWRFGRRSPLALVLALAGGWAIAEWLRSKIFTGFPWNPLAVTFVDTPWRGSAALLGTYGLSILVVLAGGTLWLAARRRWPQSGGLAVVLAALALVPAPADLPSRPDGQVRKDGQVRIVQPNIGQEDKWRPGFTDEAARRLAGLSVGPGAEPRLLFWPEAAVTEPLEDLRSDEHRAMAQFERSNAAAVVRPGEYLLTGGIALFGAGGRLAGAANSVFVLDPGGNIVFRYDKAHLVPYGEYLPMRPFLSAIGLSRLAPGDTDFQSGPGPRSFAIPGWGKAGFQICYEIIFSGEVVDRSDRPDFIFNPSNDAWFGSWGPPQHLAQARLRAAEEGLPVIRSTPTGISAVIDSSGQIRDALEWRQAGAIDAVLPAPAEPTVFARTGNVLPLVAGLLLLICGIVLDARRRYSAGVI